MYKNAEDESEITFLCLACNPDGEHPYHLAHVLLWQSGGNWVPSCSKAVLWWWGTDWNSAAKEMEITKAPDKWIKPL